MNELQQRLNAQPLSNNPLYKSEGKNGAVQVQNYQVAINEWAQLLPTNPNRQFLYIKNLGGNNGYCKVEMSLDRQNANAVFDIDDFNPRFVPTNAIFVRVSDPLATGSTVVNIQVMEG